MEKFLKNQQIPLTQVIDPSTGQAYYAPQNVVYDDKVDSGPTYLRDVIVDQAVSSSYFSGSVQNAISASYALTASYVAGLSTSSISSSYALTASYANYAETASSALNAQDILIYVKNQSGAPIAKGVVVHITASGNSSDIPRVITASYENDNNSANTLGITNQSIANGAEGFVMTEGVLKGIDTNAFVSGQLIYLGPTGSIIGYAPTAPLHSVRLGQVVREQSNNGSIYVRIDNGYELGELHDVVDTTTSSSYGDLLVKSGSVWTNSKQLTGSYSLTGSLTISGSSTFTNIGPAIFSGSVTSTGGFTGSFIATTLTASSATISGNVTVLGTASINTLVVNQIGYSSGSNQLGDAANDTQTLYGSVIIPTGSLTVSGALAVSSSQNSYFVGSGTVGIGTTTPVNPGSGYTGLTINSVSAGGYLWFQNAGTTQYSIGAEGGNIYHNITSGAATYFRTGGSYWLTIAPTTGNILINTTTDSGYKLDVNGAFISRGNAVLLNNLTSNAYFSTTGISSDGRMALYGTDSNGTIQLLAHRGAFSGGAAALFPGSVLAGGGLTGAIGLQGTQIAIQAHVVGIGVTNSGTHKSLAIGTPNTSVNSGFGGNADTIDIGTFSSVSNTWGGTRPSITYTALHHIFKVNTGTGQNNPGTTAVYISSSGAVGIGTSTPNYTLDVLGSSEFVGNMFLTGSLSITGSAGTGSALYAYKSGSTVLDIQGSQGQLFSVTDALSGSLMSVNDVSGLPILEVFSDDRVVMGTYGAPGLTVSGSTISATGSLLGTASLALTSSYVLNAVSASFARTASYVNTLVQNVSISGTLDVSSPYAYWSNGTPPNIKLNTTTGIAGILQIAGDSTTIKLWQSSGAGNGIAINSAYSGPGAHLSFGRPSEGGGTVFMYIVRDTGNVLINTATDAGYKLDVSGTARFTGNTYLASDILVSQGGGTRYIQASNGSIGFLSSNSSGYNLWTTNTYVSAKNTLYISSDLNYNNQISLGNTTTQTSPTGYGYELSFQPRVNHVSTLVAIRGTDSAYGGNSTTPVPIYIFGGQNTTTGMYGDVILQSDFTGSRGNVAIGKTSATTKLDISGSTFITGSLSVTGGITGSITSASFASTASFVNPLRQTVQVTGSILVSGSNPLLRLNGSGSELMSVDGASGRLFTVSDDLTNSLFSVNTIAGLPVIEAYATNDVYLGKYGVYPIKTVTSGTLAVITGSLLGTASFATSASWAPSSPAFPFTGSARITGSLNVIGDTVITGSFKIKNGTTPVMDTTLGYLYDTYGNASVSFSGNQLLNYYGINSVNWGSYYLIGSSGNISVDWDNRILNDSTGAARLRWNTSGIQVTGSIIQNASTASFGGVVGIGTTSPAQKLDVSAGHITTYDTSAKEGKITFNNNASALRWDQLTQKLHLTVATRDKLTIDNNGLVGINQISPSYQLDVSGSINTNTGLTVTGSLNLNGSDISSSWTSYTPTWTTDSTQPTLGNGTLTGAYKVVGKTCFVRVRLVWGTTTNSGTGAFYFDLPVTASSTWGIQMPASILDNGNAWYQATVNGEYGGFTTKTALIGQSAGANSSQGITGVFPFTFGNLDSIQFNGSYEIA